MSLKVEGKDRRDTRTYNMSQKFYEKSMRRAKKQKGHLGNLLENTAICFGLEMDITATLTIGNFTQSIDVFSMKRDDIVDILQRFKKANKVK